MTSVPDFSDRFARTELLLGKEKLEKLAGSTVAVFGIGGVGSFVVEALARAGIGHLVLVDYDTIASTNINRQIHATIKTVGEKKTHVMRSRILDINPEAVVDTLDEFYCQERAEEFFRQTYDYVVDAIDTVAGKASLVLECRKRGIPLICSMGAGNKMNPGMFQVADIYDTSVDPLARVMRKKLREQGVERLKVVYSREKPASIGHLGEETQDKLPVGSISFVPSTAGLMLAGEVVRDLLDLE